jgi:5-methylcytosine-specific restriction endonuclease McrA
MADLWQSPHRDRVVDEAHEATPDVTGPAYVGSLRPATPSRRKRRKGLSNGDAKRRTLIERDGPTCRYCRRHRDVIRGRRLTVDHVVPTGRGGTSDLSNLVLACELCNVDKGDKLVHEWKRRWYHGPDGWRLSVEDICAIEVEVYRQRAARRARRAQLAADRNG